MVFLYKATLNRVVSPVTVSATIDLGFSIKKTEAFRLNGVSMPESKEDKEKAVQLISDWFARHPVFIVNAHKNKVKFGRYLADIMDRHGGTLNQALLNADVVEEIPECEIPEEEEDEPSPEEEVEAEEVEPEELPPVDEADVEDLEVPDEVPTAPTEPEGEEPEGEEGEVDLGGHEEGEYEEAVHIPGEIPSEEGDLLEEVVEEDKEDLAEEVVEATRRRRRWRLRS